MVEMPPQYDHGMARRRLLRNGLFAGLGAAGLTVSLPTFSGVASAATTVNLNNVTYQAQPNWWYCGKCACCFFSNAAAAPVGVCAAGGHHSGSAHLANYEMPHGGPKQGNPATNPYGVQTGWRWCGKCQLIFWGSGVGSSNCPIGGTHTLSSGTIYDLAWGQIPSTNVYQISWQFCNQCQTLYWPGGSKDVHFTNGVCPGTTFPFTGHKTPPGSDYALVIYA
jgi:hypothetical protein